MTETKYEITESSVAPNDGIVTPQVTYSGDDAQSLSKNSMRYTEDMLRRYSYGHVASGCACSAGGGALVNIAAGKLVIGGRSLNITSTKNVTLTASGSNYIYVDLDDFAETSTRDPRTETFSLHASGSYTPMFTRLLLATATLNGATAEDVEDVRHAPDFTTSNIYPALDTSFNIYSYYGVGLAGFTSGSTELYSDNLYVTGDTVMSGTLEVQGTVDLVDDLDIGSSNFTVDAATGNVYTAGTLSVDGTASIGNDLSIATDKFQVDAGTGDTDIAGNTDIGGYLYVTSNFKVNTTKFTVDAATGNTVVAGTLDTTGDFKVNTDKFIAYAATGNAVIAGTLDVGDQIDFDTHIVGGVYDSRIIDYANYLEVSRGGTAPTMLVYADSFDTQVAVRLSDNVGVKKFAIKDSDWNDRFTVNSDGNVTFATSIIGVNSGYIQNPSGMVTISQGGTNPLIAVEEAADTDQVRIRLSDTAGAKKFVIEDSAGTNQVTINSDGLITCKDLTLDAGGNIVFTTTQTGYVSVAGVNFRPILSTVAYESVSAGTLKCLTGTSTTFTAPIHLPDNVTITSAICYGTTYATWVLKKLVLYTAASSTVANENLGTSDSCSEAADSSAAYYLQVNLDNGETVYGGRVQYTYTTLPVR